MPLSDGAKAVITLGVVGGAAAAVYIATRHPPPPPPTGAMLFTADGSQSPVAVQVGTVLNYRVTGGIPSDGVDVVYADTPGGTVTGKPSGCLGGVFGSNGVFSCTDVITAAGTFYAAAQDTSTGTLSNWVEITVSTCPPQSCPCDEVWDPVLCQCSKLVPASFSIDTSPSALTAAWMFYYGCSTQTLCAGLEPQVSPPEPPYCVFGPGLCQSPPLPLFFTLPAGHVVDSAGHPVCGVSISSFTNMPGGGMVGIYEIQASLFRAEMTVDLSVPSETASDGSFGIKGSVSMDLRSVDTSQGCCFAGCQDPVPYRQQIDITLQSPGLPSVTVTLEISFMLCQWIDSTG